jgi:hypothetical protein
LISGLVALYPESVILLCQIAERNHDDRREDLCNGGIKMELLHEKLDEDIIQQQADHHQDKVSEKLHPAMQGRSCKDDIPVEEKTRRKADGKRNKEGKDIWGDHQRAQYHIVLTQNKVIADGINENIQECSSSSASCVPEGLQGHQLTEGRIEKINKIDNPFLYHSIALLMVQR